MKVLILTCNTGGGHNTAAASVQEAFVKAGWSCDIADALAFISKRVPKIMGSGHNWIYRHAPALFNFGYQFSEQHPDLFQEESGLYKFLSVGTGKMKACIVENGYDMVICTHAFAALMLTGVLKDEGLEIRTGFISTDYTCYPSIEESELDWYFISDESSIADYVAKGLPREKLVSTGIPVSARFCQRRPTEQAKRLLGIRPEQKHLLVMCGSMGCGPIRDVAEELVDRLPGDAVMTVICGSNESLYRKLTQKLGDDERIRILGFTDQVSQLMDSADLYLTKAGGLSTTEALNKQLPMCLIDAIAGCEEYNANYFVRRGMAVTTEDEDALAGLCIDLLNSDEQLAKMREQMKLYSPGNAAENIVKFIVNGVN